MLITIYPRQKEGWYYVEHLIDIAEISKYILDNYKRTRIMAITICGSDFRRFILTNQHKIKVFEMYLRNSLGTGQLKIRVLVNNRRKISLP